MGNDLNSVSIIGRLTKNPERRTLQSGTDLASFTLASGKSYKSSTGEKKDETLFIPCIVWGKPSSIIMQYTSKGSQLAIQGRLRQSNWEQDGKRQTRIELIVENFQFLSKNHQSSTSQPESQGQEPLQEQTFNDDDIPF